MAQEKSNSYHRDLFSKVSISLISVICIGVLSVMYGVFRAEIVLADDLDTALKPVHEAIVRVEASQKSIHDMQTKQNSLIEVLAQNQIDDRIDRYEDNIRTLEATSRSRDLSPDEAYRLSRYKDDLEKEKLRRR